MEDVYRSLLKAGYKLNEIDTMDIFYFLYLIGDEDKKLTPIDQLNW